MGCQELVVEVLSHFTHYAYDGYAEDAPNAEVNMLKSATISLLLSLYISWSTGILIWSRVLVS